MRKKLLRSRSGFEKPESREEAIMQNILGASNVLEPAESNIEEILQAILYNTPYTKEAESEIEKILLAIKNNGTYDGTSADGTEPITTPIYLPTPLYSGEVMRSDGTITRSDGTTETFTAPQIPTINGTTVIDVDTAVKPSSIYIEYK